MQLLNRISPKVIIGLAGVVLIALAVIMLMPSSAPAQPVISWVPESLNDTVLPGETKTVSVSFTTSRELGAIEVRVVPELEPYVTTNPTSFTSITAGQTTNLDITISAPADATPQTVEGTIQIRNAGQPPRNFARPLPVEVAITPIPLPPDPGEAGKATLEGIDSDGDGVRDDIQRYIVLTYPDSERTRAALTQTTKATQASIIEAENKAAANARTVEVFRGIECLYTIRPNDARSILDALRAEILNTVDRTEAWLRGDQHFGGESYLLASEGEETSRCDFNVNAMEN